MRKFISLIIFVQILTSCQQAEKLPNVIYVLTDDLGYADVKAFDINGKIATPHLDKMANEGAMFTDAHTTSAVCTPTRYSILTGRYNWRTRLKASVLNGKSKALIQNETTVAHIFKQAGYHTAFIGKWHLGWDWAKSNGKIDYAKKVTNTPNDKGFDYAYGHCGSLDMAPYVYVENGQPTAIPDSIIPAQKGYGKYRKGAISPDFKIDEVTPNFFNRANKYIAEQAKKDEPFFLYLPIPAPHTPILPTAKWQGKSNINPYADFVMMIDDYMGKLFKQLEKCGIDDNTLVIFTSDNGCSPTANFDVLKEYNHHPNSVYRGYKSTIYEGGHRVPFIVRWPNKIQKNTKLDNTISTVDFMATAADIVNITLKDNEGVDSYSMYNLLTQPSTAEYERPFAIFHSINGNFSIRKDQWKLELCAGSGGWSHPTQREAKQQQLPSIQLYNLEKDITEQNNVYLKHPSIVKELYQLLMNNIKNGRSTEGTRQENAPNRKNKGRWFQLEELENLDLDMLLKQ